MWIKNTEGKPDAMLTFSAIGFMFVTLNIFLATISPITIWTFTLNPQFMGSDVMAAYLGSTFTSYCMRKYTDKKFNIKEPKPKKEQPEVGLDVK